MAHEKTGVCVHCGQDLGGGDGAWFSLIPPFWEHCHLSPTRFHEGSPV